MILGELTLPCLQWGGVGAEVMPTLLLLAISSSPVGKAGLGGDESERAGPASCWLQHLGEQALYLAWTAQQK